tara:strand:+ start:243 stop:722 length:480 start_codon:yes stop_codon:yes gene_type:complete
MNSNSTYIGASLLITALVSLCAVMPGCGEEAEDGPPKIMLGESSCAECGMIISDERFATATVINGTRGIQPVLFDDFNCQINFEHKNPETEVITRWSHDYPGLMWSPTGSGWFVMSPTIRSPMASNMAFFRDREDAESMAHSVSGQVLDFDTAWAQPKK